MTEAPSGEETLPPQAGSPQPGDQPSGEAMPGVPVSAEKLGLSLGALDDTARQKFNIAESVEGVVITSVEAGSAAAEKGLAAGEVIVEVAQEFMETPDRVSEVLQRLKSEGRRSAHMMIANPAGDLRFVAIPLE